MEQALAPPLADVAVHADEAAELLSALANGPRLLIMCHLAAAGELPVGALVSRIGLSQSALSQHLAKLRQHGAVIGMVEDVVARRELVHAVTRLQLRETVGQLTADSLLDHLARAGSDAGKLRVRPGLEECHVRRLLYLLSPIPFPAWFMRVG